MAKTQRKFKTGDIVRLVSDINSTIPMTVDCYAEDQTDFLFLDSLEEDDVYCIWMDIEQHLQSHFFKEKQLELFNKE